MKKAKVNPVYVTGIALLSVYLFWGGTYAGMKIAIETMPPFLMAGVRFFAAGAVLYILSRLSGAKRPARREWRSSAIVGALLLLGGNGLVAWSEQRVSSSIASLIVAAVPVWMMLMSWFGRGGKRPSAGIIAGVVLGLVGIAVLVFQPGHTGGGGATHLPAIITLLLASVSWAAGSMYSRNAVMPESPLMSTAAQMLTGGALLLVFSYFTGDWSKLDVTVISVRSYMALGYLIVFGSIVGYTAYIWLLKNADAALVSTYAFVNPVVAVLLGWLLVGEQLTVNTLTAAVIIVAAVVLVTIFRSRPQRTATQAALDIQKQQQSVH
ncbi:EamA family transporter [Paenibacillus sp. MMS20-IR301]|uniref:EamA family transporter n=1 Tax=Paenibacillus sp. MMS20-IR301 TaxID=2895946 RepID=UPI0028E33154|nr:EamA family transporter [Paenibacillus sp. MMS20-IR301]WNS47080.1 EamA family transporter [Paenibacillus sp. MMS20-IR301]